MKTSIIMLSFAIFILNDLVFLELHDYETFFAFEYMCRVVVLLAIGFGFFKGAITPKMLRLNPISSGVLVAEVTILTAVSLLLFVYLYPAIPSYFEVFEFPEIKNKTLFYFDITVGVLMVALTEEFLFRGLIFNHLQSHKILYSSIFFGLIHWGNGLGSLVVTTIIGLMFGHSVAKTDSIYPVIIAHFLVDFFLFSEIIG